MPLLASSNHSNADADGPRDRSQVGTDPREGNSAPPRTAERLRLMHRYHRILDNVIREMGGEQATTNSELEHYLQRFGLTPCEVGTLGNYEKRTRTVNPPKYGIYNTMYEAPGQHWFCCYGNYKYDPLGDDASDTQEQPSGDDDCGQRCIAYLLMCKKNGGPIHM